MSALLLDWLNLLTRWIHVLAAIMWVGDSFLFMWLDSHLSEPTRPREGAVTGELWMVHSGGFYEVVKRKSLAKDELPANLYWFKWESYTTWISGAFLLGVVYFAGGDVFLVDRHSRFGVAAAIALVVGFLAVGWLVYDLLWKTLGQKRPALARYASWALLAVAVVALTRLFPGRAAFLVAGAMLGTIMAANVRFRIVPAQTHMLAQTRAGLPVDTSYGARAKQRSTHNHFLTLPVLFAMLSNHFPGTYGQRFNWAALLLLFVVGASLKYVMSFKLSKSRLVPALGAAALVAVVAMSLRASRVAAPDFANAAPVPFARVQTIIATRCLSCHARHPGNPAFSAPPLGIVLEDPARVRALASRILERAVITKTMPLANLTGMTEAERATLGAWIVQGASIAGAPADVAAPLATTAAATSPAEAAKQIFSQRCAACHGVDGRGDGPAGAALNPKPRDYTDHAWQTSVSDERLRQVIAQGGPAVGKSPLMPPNPDLASDRPVLDALVKIVRGFDRLAR